MSIQPSPGPFASMPREPEDPDPYVQWKAHVDAGRIGARSDPAPDLVARRIRFSEALLGRRLRRHEGGAA